MPFTRFRRLADVGAVVATAACPAAARADAVTDWNGYANAAIFSTAPPAHSAVLSTATVQGAVYDAVNAIAGGYRPYLWAPPPGPVLAGRRGRHRHGRLPRRIDARPLQLPTLEGQYLASLAAVPDGRA